MLHWILESRPEGATDSGTVAIDEHELKTLDIPPPQRGNPLGIQFDQLAEKLIATDGVYWEPDGSFAWTIQSGADGSKRIRVEGQLADGVEYLQHAEFWGAPSLAMLDQLIAWTSNANSRVMFQIVRAGVYIDETNFRKLCHP